MKWQENQHSTEVKTGGPMEYLETVLQSQNVDPWILNMNSISKCVSS